MPTREPKATGEFPGGSRGLRPLKNEDVALRCSDLSLRQDRQRGGSHRGLSNPLHIGDFQVGGDHPGFGSDVDCNLLNGDTVASAAWDHPGFGSDVDCNKDFYDRMPNNWSDHPGFGSDVDCNCQVVARSHGHVGSSGLRLGCGLQLQLADRCSAARHGSSGLRLGCGLQLHRESPVDQPCAGIIRASARM